LTLRGTNRGHGFETTGYDVAFEGPVPEADIAAALGLVREALAPAGNALAVAEITKLRLMTKARGADDADTRAWLSIFGRELAAYPADIVTAACREWTEGNVFVPAWAELRAICERLAMRRRAIADALERQAEKVAP